MNVKDAFKRSVPKSVSASWDNTSSKVSHGLTSFVKTLRNAPNEKKFISQTIDQMKQDFRGNDVMLKAQAIAKLTFLYMLGHDISWAAFHIVEVMSSNEFDYQRVGCFAAALCFRPETDVLLLTTNWFKHHFTGGGGSKSSFKKRKKGIEKIETLYTRCIAMNCLASIVSLELAQNLLTDIFNQLNSTKPNLRKRAVLLLFPVFRRWPKALRLSFDRLKARLKDEHQAVRVAAVNVICELSKINPGNYLNAIPQLYELLQTTSSNWMLIKIVKLMSNILPIEPRLMKKLREPLVNIISGSSARSLVYECTNCITSHGTMAKEVVNLCVEKLQLFIEDPDPNFKYLGMCGLCKIQHQAPGKLVGMKDLIIERLNEVDVSIKRRALEILSNMVQQNNMIEIVMKLQEHLLDQDDNAYMNSILTKIITVCSQDDYSFIDDFVWYIGTLKEFSYLSMNKHNADLISFHIMDVIYRVEDIREFGVQQMEELLIENQLLGDNVNLSSTNRAPILYAVAFILGEYGEFISGDNFDHLLQLILQARVKSLPADVQAVFLNSALKIVGYALTKLDWENSIEVIELAINQIEQFTTSKLAEVQERSAQYLEFMKGIYEDVEYEDELTKLGEELVGMYAEKLAPVDPEAQILVNPPKGLNLEKMMGEPLPDDVGFFTMVNDEKEPVFSQQLADMDGEEWLNEDTISKPKAKKKKLVSKAKTRQRAQKRGVEKQSPFYIDDMESQNTYEDEEEDDKGEEDEFDTDDPKVRMKQRFLDLQRKAKSKNRKRKPTKYKVTKGAIIVKGKTKKSKPIKKQAVEQKFVDPLAMVDLRVKHSSDEDPGIETKTYEQLNAEKLQAEMGLVSNFKKSEKKAKKKKAKKKEAKDDAAANEIKKKAIAKAKKGIGESPKKLKRQAKGKKKKKKVTKSNVTGVSKKQADLLDFGNVPGQSVVPVEKSVDFLDFLDDFTSTSKTAASKPISPSPLDIFDNLSKPAESNTQLSQLSTPPREQEPDQLIDNKEVEVEQQPKKNKKVKPKTKKKRKPVNVNVSKKPAGKKRSKGKKRSSTEKKSNAVAPLELLDDLIENDNISEILATKKKQKTLREEKMTTEDEKMDDLLSLSASKEEGPIDPGFDLMGFIDSTSPKVSTPVHVKPAVKSTGGGIFGMMCNPSENDLISEHKDDLAPTSNLEVFLSTNVLTISYAVDYSPGRALILKLTCECRPGGKTIKNITLFIPPSGPIHLPTGDQIVLVKSLKPTSSPRIVILPLNINKVAPTTLPCKVSYKCGKVHSISTQLEVTAPMLLKQSKSPSPATIGKLINADKEGVVKDLPGISPSLMSEIASVLLLQGCLQPLEPIDGSKNGPWRFYTKTITRKSVLLVFESTGKNGLRLTVRGSSLKTQLADWFSERLLSEFVEEDEEEEDDE